MLQCKGLVTKKKIFKKRVGGNREERYWEKVRNKAGSDFCEPQSTSSYTQKWDPQGSVVHGVMQNIYYISYISYPQLPRAGHPVVSV